MRLIRMGIVVAVIVALAVVFSAELFYFASWWHERAGHVKKAVRNYERFVERYPRSRFAGRARESLERLREEARKAAGEDVKRRRKSRRGGEG